MKPVLLATDGSPTAEQATRTAIELAQLLDTQLVVVTVWDVGTFPTRRGFERIEATTGDETGNQNCQQSFTCVHWCAFELR